MLPNKYAGSQSHVVENVQELWLHFCQKLDDFSTRNKKMERFYLVLSQF